MGNLSGIMYATLLACGCVTALTAPHCRAAEEPAARILVSGQGSVDMVPDMAMLTLTVTREAETARAALDANSDAMQQVVAAMRAEGIDEKDLQTTGFSIQPRYVYPSPKTPGEDRQPSITGYTVRNTLSVQVRDIGAIGRILDKSVTLGVNEGGQISFTNDDPSAAITRARVKAVQDAIAKASTLADAAGVTLGRLLELSEQAYQPMLKVERSMALAADTAPVLAGENTYRVSVEATFAIVP